MADEKTVADIIVTQRTIWIYLLGEIEHLLGLFEVAHFGIGNNAIAVGRLKFRLDTLNLLKQSDAIS